jgi:hypothetical protein
MLDIVELPVQQLVRIEGHAFVPVRSILQLTARSVRSNAQPKTRRALRVAAASQRPYLPARRIPFFLRSLLTTGAVFAIYVNVINIDMGPN